LKKCILIVLFNQLFVVLPGLCTLDYFSKLGFLRGIRFEEQLPSIMEVFIHAIASALCVEIGFFYSHYALHSPWLYSRVHKIHHEFLAPEGLAAIYAHPLEALVGNTFAVMGGAFVVGLHGFSWYIGVVIGWLLTISGHSGYGLFWQKKRHDLHHQLFNCNYGSFFLLDRLHGTYKAG
jgi:sterol desaturase/sphingolipid hydroxylase (fatty acid hydroxylase superfamily)